MSIRLYCTQDFSPGTVASLTADQVHYLQHVMRCSAGESILVFNGRDGEWKATISDLKKKHGALELQALVRPQGNEPDVWLAFAPVKNAALHFLAQKATELGVSALQPVFTEYTAVSRVNTEKLAANAIEAAEQCGRLTIPTTQEPQALHHFLAKLPANRTLIYCDESGKGQPIAKALENKNAKHWAILIGPEGGFSPLEREQLYQHPQTLAVGLGPRILRADTAALAALACFQALQGDGI